MTTKKDPRITPMGGFLGSLKLMNSHSYLISFLVI